MGLVGGGGGGGLGGGGGGGGGGDGGGGVGERRGCFQKEEKQSADKINPFYTIYVIWTPHHIRVSLY